MRPPTPPKDAASANLALLLSPPAPEPEGASAEAKPAVDDAEAEEILLCGELPRPGAGSGVGEVAEDKGVTTKLRVDRLR